MLKKKTYNCWEQLYVTVQKDKVYILRSGTEIILQSFKKSNIILYFSQFGRKMRCLMKKHFFIFVPYLSLSTGGQNYGNN